MGPIVRIAELTLWPIPCIVPSTLGCGEALLTRMAVAGSAKVRARTWMLSTIVRAVQRKKPDAGAGGEEEVGTTARKGTSV